ncbi:response regulator [Pseudanabaena sp. FACHB-1998]|uniref:response regulator n=1 Tax=Pseudanabaena sp. FACHB-1998 TaxID=2692858 RepID=UPI001681428A|nr:response regulator [Pseudanabaena sp. FACHB-1998]MBD2176145.1 response regulator [Pseudanabaena sp. FACHB-1998]
MKQSTLLKKLLTASERSFIVIDRECIIIDTSHGAERFSECPNESLLHKDIRQVFPETIGLEEVFSDIWLNQATSFEMNGICRNFSSRTPIYFDFYIIGTNEIDEADKHIILCIEDTTEMMMMSQVLMQRANESELLANELLKSKEYTDKIISAMADALIVTDLKGIIKTVNSATVNLFGYTAEELVNNSINLLFKDPSNLNLVDQECPLRQKDECPETCINNNHCFQHIEVLCLSKAQEELLIYFSCSRVTNHEPNYPLSSDSFVYVGRNITEIRRKEQELLEAREIAEQSVQTKSIFLANMSHEIRTPMNGVLGMTDLLLGTSLDNIQREFTENIRLSGNLLLSLINRILDLSKLEQGELELENLPFNLEQSIEEILELFSLQAHHKSLEVNAFFGDDLPQIITGDSTRLKQILINLIGNAIKFTSEGEVSVLVDRDRDYEESLASADCHALDSSEGSANPPQVFLRFSVIDTGIGISPQNQNKLFKPFSQVDASTTRRFGGTGLGLAICRQLVELMQGEIGVVSPIENEKGTCFWFRIPFVSPSSISPKVNLNLSHDIYTLYSLKQKHILVVDASPKSRQAIHYYLAKAGAEVYGVANLVEAIAYYKKNQNIDLVLIDWKLISIVNTKADSNDIVAQFGILQKLRASTLVALITANLQSEIPKILKKGFYGHIAKPFKGERLLKTVALAITSKSSPITVIQPSSSNHPQPKVISEVDASEFSKLKVLLAEDNVVNQKIAMTYLSQLNCQADLAENGEEVLRLLKQKDYDIILMDCQMPYLDGYGTTQAIRQLESSASSMNQAFKHTIIVAMTANAFKEDRDRCLAIGMDDYLSKPIRRDDLKTTLKYWLSKIK